MSSLTINPPPNQRQGRLMLALIVGFLALPFVIGAALYFGGWHPPRISHHGHLVNPPRQLSGQPRPASGGLCHPVQTAGQQPDRVHRDDRHVPRRSGLAACRLMLAATVGIALVAGAAAAINCLVERTIDARMARTRGRALPLGLITPTETLTLACLTGGAGLWLLHVAVNPLTMWLTLATFLGYAIVYTLILKPATPMNIVIGGASGAMPPVLGWAAMTDSIGLPALALFLIIFLWTPPHFWALACYRREEYARAGLPMLPVSHGVPLTCLHILLYTVLLAAVSYLPCTLGLSGAVYAAWSPCSTWVTCGKPGCCGATTPMPAPAMPSAIP
jgi:protoheme IX farnesyltransferase